MSDSPVVLDIRPIPSGDRRPTLVATFRSLRPGASVVLVNDDDPRVLRQAEGPDEAGVIAWEYLEEGPPLWRVRVSRVA